MQFRKGLHFLLPGWFSKTLAGSPIEISAKCRLHWERWLPAGEFLDSVFGCSGGL
jgi:hypothetical protein